MNKLKEWLRWKLKNWLGITVIERELYLNIQETKVISKEFYSQMKMVGVDVQVKNSQTQIIFVSRLGRDGLGTVKIIDCHFATLKELTDFMHAIEDRYKPAPFAIDALPGFGEFYRRR